MSRVRVAKRPHARLGRVAFVNARRSRLELPFYETLWSHSISRAMAPVSRRSPYRVSTLYQVEDNRRWNPEGRFYTHHTLSGAPARTVAATAPSRRTPSNRYTAPFSVVAFHAPAGVVTCVRRHRRREVLFANNKAGRGKSIYTKPRRNWSSSISCRG